MVTIYITKYFVKGPLKGISYLDAMPGFPTAEAAAKWANKHKRVPVRSIGGADYLITDCSFQAYKR